MLKVIGNCRCARTMSGFFHKLSPLSTPASTIFDQYSQNMKQRYLTDITRPSLLVRVNGSYHGARITIKFIHSIHKQH